MSTDTAPWPPPEPAGPPPAPSAGSTTDTPRPIPVLLYHSVSSSHRWNAARWWMPPARFDEHLHVIDELGYEVLTLSDLLRRTARADLPERVLAITFDDGFADFADEVTPLLQRRGQRATVYTVAGYLGATSAWLRDDHDRRTPMMTADDLRAVRAAGMEVGAHSMTHPQLDLVGRERARDEIARSREVLSDLLGEAVRSFAYPHGYHSTAVRNLVVEAGFDSACAVKNRWSDPLDDPFSVARLIVDGDTTAEQLWDVLASRPERTEKDHPVARSVWRTARRMRHVIDRRRPTAAPARR